MKKLLLLTLSTVFSCAVFSQEDTEKTVQDLEEIVVQGQVKENQESHGLQNSTDKFLESSPEVTLIKRGNYAQEPTIRGLNAGQINLTIDGMQMFGACTDRMDPISSYIEPTNLEKIQLNTTPNERQTGSSIGGGINFALVKAQLNATKQYSGKVGLGYETNANNIQTLGTFQFSTERWAVLVNGIYRKAGNYYASNRKEVLFSQFEKWNAGINFVVALNNKNKIYLDYIQDEGYNIGYPALTMDVGFAKAYISAITHVYENKQKKLREIETKVFSNFINHTMDDTKRPKELVYMHMDMPGTSFTFGMFSKAKILLNEKHLTSVQVNTYQNYLHAEMTMYPDQGSEMFMLTIPDGKRSTYGVTIADLWNINPSLKMSYGARLEQNLSNISTEIGRQTLTSFYNGSSDKSTISGNIFAQTNYALTSIVELFGGINYAQRPPSLKEIYGFYLFNRADNYDYIGNPDLKNEGALNGNIGLKVKQKTFKFSSEIFINSFTDYITGTILPSFSTMTYGADGVKQYRNIPHALLVGGELTVEWSLMKNISLKSSNSYTYGVDNDRDYLPFIPPFKSINSISYHLKNYHFRIEHIGATAQKRVSKEKYGENSTPRFNVLNFYVQKHVEIKNKTALHIEVGAENIFDVSYYEHLDVMAIPRQGLNFLFRTTLIF